MLEKYKYLFDDETNTFHRESMVNLKINWRELKAIKRESETVMPKVYIIKDL
jgi:hypothetical protein